MHQKEEPYFVSRNVELAASDSETHIDQLLEELVEVFCIFADDKFRDGKHRLMLRELNDETPFTDEKIARIQKYCKQFLSFAEYMDENP